MSTVVDGYESQDVDVQAILDADLDAEDLADPTLLYVRATQLRARYQAVIVEVERLRAQAVHRMSANGSSYAQIAATTGLSRARVQQLVHAALGP